MRLYTYTANAAVTGYLVKVVTDRARWLAVWLGRAPPRFKACGKRSRQFAGSQSAIHAALTPQSTADYQSVT